MKISSIENNRCHELFKAKKVDRAKNNWFRQFRRFLSVFSQKTGNIWKITKKLEILHLVPLLSNFVKWAFLGELSGKYCHFFFVKSYFLTILAKIHFFITQLFFANFLHFFCLFFIFLLVFILPLTLIADLSILCFQ